MAGSKQTAKRDLYLQKLGREMCCYGMYENLLTAMGVKRGRCLPRRLRVGTNAWMEAVPPSMLTTSALMSCRASKADTTTTSLQHSHATT